MMNKNKKQKTKTKQKYKHIKRAKYSEASSQEYVGGKY